ncbi:MAG: putative secreted protein [Nocardia sp.]|uniref:hypothetical protein n=1 Tax=Nocardia sp. TaxID=1821 RepID=UPI00262F7003|nr:hypothetical protein [Nocardia sp.]MCU1645625.1 putative secreted protein [Nocardia sp.]
MKRPDTRQLLAWWRLVRIPVVLVVLYLALRPVLAALSERHGFGSPDGMGLGYLAVAAALVALRITLLIIVPAILTYRLAAWAVTRILYRFASPTPPDGVASSTVHEQDASSKT